MTSINMLVASGDTQFRTHLRDDVFPREDVRVRGETDQFDGLLLLAAAQHPDIILLGEDIDSEGALHLLRAENPRARTLLVVDKIDARVALLAIRHGADGCMPKDARPEQWLKAVHSVLHGDIWISRRVLAGALREMWDCKGEQSGRMLISGDESCLTERQREIARCAMLGLSNKQIGRQLRISPTTVKTHMQRIFHRLNIKGRVRLVARLASALVVSWAQASTDLIGFEAVSDLITGFATTAAEAVQRDPNTIPYHAPHSGTVPYLDRLRAIPEARFVVSDASAEFSRRSAITQPIADAIGLNPPRTGQISS